MVIEVCVDIQNAFFLSFLMKALKIYEHFFIEKIKTHNNMQLPDTLSVLIKYFNKTSYLYQN